MRQKQFSLILLPTKNQNHFSDRLDKIPSLLRTDHLNEEEKSLIDICLVFNQIVFIEGVKLTHTDVIMPEISTKDSLPINTKTYRYHKDEVNQQMAQMLSDNIIEPSISRLNQLYGLILKNWKPLIKRKGEW